MAGNLNFTDLEAKVRLLEKEVADAKLMLKNMRGSPIVQGYANKKLDLNDHLNVVLLNKKVDSKQDNLTNSDTEIVNTVNLAHDRLHSISSTTDHSSTTVPGSILKADANGLPEAATSANLEASHTHSKLVASDGSPDPALECDSSGNTVAYNNIIIPKTAGVGIKVDTSSPTYPWRDLLGSIETRPAAGGGAAAIPDFVQLRTGVWMWRFGTTAPDNHLHEAFINFHAPHDLVPNSDLFFHIHWAQNVVDTGGAAGVPGNAKWYADISYADGHGTAGGSADPFTAIKTFSVVQQGSTTQYGHMIAEVQISNNGGTGGLFDSTTITVDGVFVVRFYRDPADAADTLNQNAFSPFADLHYQSVEIGTKQKAPNFYV